MIHDCLFCSRFFTFLMLKCYMIFRGITSICPTFSARKFLAFRPWGPPDLRSWRPPRSWASSWYPGPTCHPQRTVRVLSLECCGLRHKIWRYGWYQDIIVDAYAMSIVHIYMGKMRCSSSMPNALKRTAAWAIETLLRSTWSWDFARSEADVRVRIPSMDQAVGITSWIPKGVCPAIELCLRCGVWDAMKKGWQGWQGWHVFGGPVHDHEKAIEKPNPQSVVCYTMFDGGCAQENQGSTLSGFTMVI